MDNCSSGSASRMFINKRSQAKPTGDRKARCIVATNEMVKIDLQARKDRGTTRSFNPYDGTNEILFAACQSTEYAYESNGGGDFTRHALKILNETGGNLSCKDFMRLIRKAFGLDAKQTPGLWCNSSLEDSGFLGATHRTAEFGDEQFGSSDSAYAKAIGQIKSIVDRMEG
jgi:hypothetical protein